ncbi:uracil-DNA glycosylase [Candidatus Sulfurimonas baltica]|uniref:Uracil-DNA glycosylase n=1 Tax=Candidatus Sulfurimonas baltica TaxID=2740404 RepID=A0A7S7RLL1_9BACT|nr:uracil-DNA glycosylase [Candidatus Sulfurimonas baltica]QOY51252.1 uracil-DNA glycosylase [Candidatus Sulfurimonas baltica]
MLLNKEWSLLLQNEMQLPYFKKLQGLVEQEYKTKRVFPEYGNIFRAFNLVSPEKIKVVIMGQDPYHGVNQANGLAFSVCDSCKIPPSLNNIFKELVDDIGCAIPANGNLTQWAKEGVLLINSVLTVVESKPNSHKNIGWEIFTDCVIKKLSFEYENIVFILWGGPSQKKESIIDTTKHCVLKAPHPSPLSSYRGFFGSKPFSHSNNYLREHNKKEIDWCLTSQKTLL